MSYSIQSGVAVGESEVGDGTDVSLGVGESVAVGRIISVGSAVGGGVRVGSSDVGVGLGCTAPVWQAESSSESTARISILIKMDTFTRKLLANVIR
jgi:hypothetical protein